MNVLRPRLQGYGFVLALLLALGICLRSPPCLAEEYKIGVINTDRIMRESAPAKDLFRKFGFTPDKVVAAAKQQLAKSGKRT